MGSGLMRSFLTSCAGLRGSSGPSRAAPCLRDRSLTRVSGAFVTEILLFPSIACHHFYNFKAVSISRTTERQTRSNCEDARFRRQRFKRERCERPVRTLKVH